MAAIDFHAHLARDDPDAPPFMRDLFDVEGYVERQAETGIELTVLSYALEGDGGTIDEAKSEHDFLAEVLGRYPGRFAALAGIDPFGGAEWLAEAERALELGFSGFCFPTSRRARYLDADEARDGFALADERGVVVFLHPSGVPIDASAAGNGILRAWVGRPYDTGLCLARMLLADTLLDYGDVRLVAAHSGGALPMLLGRLDHVHANLGRMASGPPGGGPPGGGPPRDGAGPPKGPPHDTVPESARLRPSLGGRPPSERLGQVYLDTASYHPAAIAAAIGAVGVDRVVLGTDYPPAGDSPAEAMEVLDRSGLTDGDRVKILETNARRLLQPVSQAVPEESI